jgi:hypothetical protein
VAEKFEWDEVGSEDGERHEREEEGESDFGVKEKMAMNQTKKKKIEEVWRG